VPKISKDSTCRSASLTVSTFRDADSSVEFIAATEAPAMVFDWERGPIEEVLLVGGIEVPRNGQVPLQDSHDLSSTKKTIGSFRDIKLETNANGETVMVGRAYFARDAESQVVAQKVKDGHITDGSVRYSPIESVWIKDGEQYNFNGRTYNGPMKLTTKAKLREFSPTPIGADEDAKSRSEIDIKAIEVETIEKAGDSSDEIRNQPALTAPVNKMEVITVPNKTETAPTVPVLDKAQIEAEASKRAIAEYKVRTEKISQVCRTLGLDTERQGWIDSELTIEQVRDAALALAEKTQTPVGVRVELTADATDKFRAAATDALVMNSGVKLEKSAPGAAELSRLGFEGIAREALCIQGVNTRNMSRIQLLTAAMGRGIASMGSADFPYILSTSANKMALAGWAQQPSTILSWAGTSNIRDFKTNDRVRLSDIASLTKVNEQGEIKRGSMSESREQYAIYTYGQILSMSRQMLINDDLGEFKKLYFGFGMAAKRTINQVGYTILSANALLSDGVALFSTAATRLNLASSGAAISATTVGTGRAAMRNQTGPNGAKLNLPVSYLICGPAYEESALIVLTSDALPTAEFSSGVINPYKNSAQVIVDSEISGNAWYLATNPNIEPTVEIGFLEGVQTPTIEALPTSNDILGIDLRCFIDFGAKALSYRGLYKNAGG